MVIRIRSFGLVLAVFWGLLAGCAGGGTSGEIGVAPKIEKPDYPALKASSDPSPNPGTFRDLLAIQPESGLSKGSDQADWYKDSVFYHVWVNAFKDSNGDGIGDISGITQKLDYLKNLGITGLWLSPFFESASEAINLHMYDTLDHFRVDPRFGTVGDVENLLKEAHKRDIRLIFDWVPNHVAKQHPWFSEHKDWFVWRNEPGSQEGPWGQSVWHKGLGDEYYYGVFWDGMPDLDYRNQSAKDAITNVAIYWLNKGFDGLRVDAVKYLYEHPYSIKGGYDDQPETIQYFQAFRKQVLDNFGSKVDAEGKGYHKFMVAENWTDSNESLIKYMVQDNRPAFHMTFDFPLAYALSRRNPSQLRRIFEWQSKDLPKQAWMGTFLSNHDNVVNRPFSVHGEPLVRVPIALQLLGSGTPFVYYGNEIGMPDASQFAGASHADRRHRQPLDWAAVEAQEKDPNSLLALHKTLLEIRKNRVSLRRGEFESLDLPGRGLLFTRTYGEEMTLVATNLVNRDMDIEMTLPDNLKAMKARLLFSTNNQNIALEGGDLSGTLVPGGTAVWSLEP